MTQLHNKKVKSIIIASEENRYEERDSYFGKFIFPVLCIFMGHPL